MTPYSRRPGVNLSLRVWLLTGCLVALLLLPELIHATQAPYLLRPCDAGWTSFPWDNSCAKLFMVANDVAGDTIRLTYPDAQAFCRNEGGWLPIIRNATAQLQLLNRVVRATARPGVSWWVGVHVDRSIKASPPQTTRWVTPAGRSTGFEFRWDGSQHMPSVEDCAVVAMKGDGVTRVGGNDKMITVDCQERHSVVCTKPRVRPSVTSVAQSIPRRVEVVWGSATTLYFAGPYIPKGMQVTMQTADRNFPLPTGDPTHCTAVHTLGGASAPRTLNVTGRTFNSSMCNGVCQEALVTFPSSWPWVRGARYSFCFFVPVPFAAPTTLSEYATEFMPAAYVEVVQRYTDYLRDLCTRHQDSVSLFYGDRRLDTNRDKVNPWYFDSPVEGSQAP